jgi:hypothetical protein
MSGDVIFNIILIFIILSLFLKLFKAIGIESKDFIFAVPAVAIWFLLDYWVVIIVIAGIGLLISDHIIYENKKHLTTGQEGEIKKLEGLLIEKKNSLKY